MCCVALPCCLTLLASFFLPSHLTLKHVLILLQCIYHVLKRQLLSTRAKLYPGMHAYSMTVKAYHACYNNSFSYFLHRVTTGGAAVCHHAARCAGGDQEVHEEPDSHPRQEGGADSGGNQTVLHPGRERGRFSLSLHLLRMQPYH